MTARAPFAVEHVDGATSVITVDGLTHGPDADELGRLLGAQLDLGRGRLVVDLRAAQLLNSKLLDALVRVSARLDPRRGEALAVVTDTGYVSHMLQIGATGGMLMLEPTREDALEALDALR